MADAPTATEPDWVLAHPLVRQALEFARTAADFTMRPAAFTREWMAGSREATNPLSMVALSLTAVASLRAGLRVSAVTAGETTGWWSTLAFTALPYLHYVLVGALTHAFIGGFRAGQPRLRSTIALMLFTAGGPITAARLLGDGTAALMRALGTPLSADDTMSFGELALHPLAGPLLLALSAATVFAIMRALVVSVATAHQLRAWVVLLAVLGALLVAGLIYGIAGLPRVPGVFQPFTFGVQWAGADPPTVNDPAS